MTVVHGPAGLPAEWPEVAAVVQVNREREVRGERAVTSHYYITSHDGTAADFGRWARGHWDIENSLHWQLDVSFGENQSRTRKDHASANLGALRRTALSLLKNETSVKVGVKNRRLTAAWNKGYLRKVLFGI